MTPISRQGITVPLRNNSNEWKFQKAYNMPKSPTVGNYLIYMEKFPRKGREALFSQINYYIFALKQFRSANPFCFLLPENPRLKRFQARPLAWFFLLCIFVFHFTSFCTFYFRIATSQSFY